MQLLKLCVHSDRHDEAGLRKLQALMRTLFLCFAHCFPAYLPLPSPALVFLSCGSFPSVELLRDTNIPDEMVPHIMKMLRVTYKNDEDAYIRCAAPLAASLAESIECVPCFTAPCLN